MECVGIWKSGHIDCLAINRVIEEYAPDTHLYNVSVAVTLTIGGVFFIALIVVAYITKKKQ